MQPRVTLLALLLSLLAAPVYATNGPQPIVQGAKGPVTLPTIGDGWSHHRMPSSLGWADSSRADLDIFLFYSQSRLKNRLNNFESTGLTPAFSGGAVIAPGRPDLDAPDEEWEDYSPKGKFTFGIGEFLELASGSGTSAYRSTAFPETKDQSSGIVFLTTAFSVAYTPSEYFSIGLGLHVIYASLDLKSLVGGGSTPLNGSPQIAGVPLPGNPSYADFLGLFASDGASDPTTYFELSLSTLQFTGILSVSLRPSPNFGFGVSYRPRSYSLPFEGKAKIDATRTFESALGGLSPALQGVFLDTLPNRGAGGFVSEYDVELNGLRVPRQVRMTASGVFGERLLVGIEATWTEWHRAFKAAKIDLTNGSNTDLNFVIGASGLTSGVVQRFRNNWTLALYTSFAVNEMLTLRAGFAHAPYPFNEGQQGNSTSSGFVSDTATVGFGLRFAERFEFNFLVEHAFYDSGTARPDVDGLTARGSRYAAKQFFIHFGLGMAF